MIMLVSHELPSGSVTLLLTEIEGATRLLNERKVDCPRHLIWRSRVRQRQTREMVSYRARRLTAEEAARPLRELGSENTLRECRLPHISAFRPSGRKGPLGPFAEANFRWSVPGGV